VPLEPGEDTWTYNATTHMINYCPSAGVGRIDIMISDGAGNSYTRSFGYGDPGGIAEAQLSMNPWDPNEGVLVIDCDYAGPAELKIYDFGGDLVRTMTTSTGVFSWNGCKQDGTRVADGVYFGQIEVKTTAGTYNTVVKIAIVEK